MNYKRYNMRRDRAILLCLFIILFIILSSCSANWHLKRALQKDPDIFRPDTITVVDTLIVPEFSDFTFIELDTGTAWIDEALRPLYAHLDNVLLRPKYAQDKEHSTVTLKTINNVSNNLKRSFQDKSAIQFPYRYEDSLISIDLHREDSGIAKLDYTIKEKLLVNYVQVPCPEYVYGMTWLEKFFYWTGVLVWASSVMAFIWSKLKRFFRVGK